MIPSRANYLAGADAAASLDSQQFGQLGDDLQNGKLGEIYQTYHGVPLPSDMPKE